MGQKTNLLLTRLSSTFANRKFRLYVGLFSISQGTFRIGLVDAITNPNLLFGTNLLFGAALIILGLALLVTTFFIKKNIILNHVIITLLAAIYSALGVAVIDVSIISAIGTFLIAAILLLEVGIIDEH